MGRLKLQSLNLPIQLLLTEDLVKLKNYLDDKIDEFLSVVKPTNQQWTEAAQVLLVRLVIFNKRIISEVEELKVSDITETQQSSGDPCELRPLRSRSKIGINL